MEGNLTGKTGRKHNPDQQKANRHEAQLIALNRENEAGLEKARNRSQEKRKCKSKTHGMEETFKIKEENTKPLRLATPFAWPTREPVWTQCFHRLKKNVHFVETLSATPVETFSDRILREKRIKAAAKRCRSEEEVHQRLEAVPSPVRSGIDQLKKILRLTGTPDASLVQRMQSKDVRLPAGFLQLI